MCCIQREETRHAWTVVRSFLDLSDPIQPVLILQEPMPIEYALSSLSHSFSRGKQKLRCDVVRFSRPTQLPPPHWSLNFCFVFYLTPLSSPLPPDAAALKSAEGFGDSDAGSETYREREKDRAERRERVTAKAKKSETPCVWKRKEERKEKRGKKREMKRQKKREEIRT